MARKQGCVAAVLVAALFASCSAVDLAGKGALRLSPDEGDAAANADCVQFVMEAYEARKSQAPILEGEQSLIAWVQGLVEEALADAAKQGVSCNVGATTQLKQGRVGSGIRGPSKAAQQGTVRANTTVYSVQGSEVNGVPFFPEEGLNLEQVALCFSGGGNRALTAEMGQIRALQNLGLMKGFGYMSTVSGGSWAASIYQFYRTGASSDEELVGAKTASLEGLNMTTLGKSPPPLGATATDDIVARFILILLSGKSSPNDYWIDSVAATYLTPFGIGGDTYYTLSGGTEAEIKADNPALANELFYTARSERPFWIANGAVLGPSWSDPTDNIVSAQFTPLYAGSPSTPNGVPTAYEGSTISADLFVGGGFVDSFSFGSAAPGTLEAQQGLEASTLVELPSTRFAIKRAVGISSMAPGYALQNTFARGLNPVQNYWPVLPANASSTQAAQTFAFGDGGNIDGLGLLAVLQRRVPKVVVFQNTDVPLPDPSVFDACTAEHPPTEAQWASTSIAPLFGVKLDSKSPNGYFGHNQVFQPAELLKLLCELQRLSAAGRPTVFSQDLEVLANEWWGIQPGRVQILWSYLAYASDFVDQLPSDTKHEVTNGTAFANFPQYKTIGQNEGRFIQYTNDQVNLLAAFTEWATTESAPLIKALLGDV